MSHAPRYLLPAALLLVGILGYLWLSGGHDSLAAEDDAPARLRLDAADITPCMIDLQLETHGLVLPRHQVSLSSQLDAVVESVSPHFVAGGFFRKGEILLTLEDSDYLNALKQAQAELARAEATLASEQAQAKVAEKEWQQLSEAARARHAAPELYLRKPQLQSARAAVTAARAAVDNARRQLARTRIRAPFNGVLRDTRVDVGQYLQAGDEIATLMGTDEAEIRLALTDKDLDLLAGVDLPRNVQISQASGRDKPLWQGQLIRLEGAMSATEQTIYAVARLQDPYNLDESHHAGPLHFGRYVRALITLQSPLPLWPVPLVALHGLDKVVVVDSNQRLQLRPVSLFRLEKDRALISKGLLPGDRVVLTPLTNPVQGLSVDVLSEPSVPVPAGSEEGAAP